MKPGIALAMIVRNDVDRIGRCLSSLTGIVRDMVVVDTGSTDGTQEAAMRLGARVVEREWPDDFALALNWAYELVEHEWTIRLDSDEWLLPASRNLLLEVASQSNVFAATVIREDYVADGRFSETEAMRLWRTDPLMRMVGLVHEQFPEDALVKASRDRLIVRTGIRFGHDGYTQQALPSKHRRNLELVERELALRPGNLYYECERIRILHLLQDPSADQETDRLMDRMIGQRELDEAPSPMVIGPIGLVLDRLPDAKLNDQRTTEILRLARGWCSDDPSVTYTAAKTFIRRGDLRSALDALLDLERMATTGEYRRSGYSHPSMLQEALWQNLAIVAHQLGRKDVAVRNYERLLRFDPQNPVARENLTKLLQG